MGAEEEKEEGKNQPGISSENLNLNFRSTISIERAFVVECICGWVPCGKPVGTPNIFNVMSIRKCTKSTPQEINETMQLLMNFFFELNLKITGKEEQASRQASDEFLIRI